MLSAWGDSQILDGNLSSSRLFGLIPLSDPFASLQISLSGHRLPWELLLGAGIILLLYALIGGRLFCAWICPINPITEGAGWLSRVLKIQGSLKLSRQTRFLLLGLALLLSLLLSTPAFEALSPIGLLQRSLFYGSWTGLGLILSLFLFDLTVLKDGFCGHLCPLGAFYSFIGRFGFLRIRFHKSRCTHCMKCHQICPERPILRPVLDKEFQGGWIPLGLCLNCGRCIEVCKEEALNFSLRPPGAGI